MRVEKCVRILDDYQTDTTIYTDGSCTAGTDDGGSAAVVTTGSARNPVVIERIVKKGGKFTYSYKEEQAAMAGPAGTLLTGVQGVDSSQLNLGGTPASARRMGNAVGALARQAKGSKAKRRRVEPEAV